MMKRIALVSTLLFLWSGSAFAQATPPDAMNYQGVLRDSDDRPLEGSYSMIFRFFDADSGGDEILVDTHAAVGVSGGLFNVRLGTGAVTDGSGPGDYAKLSRVFADHPELHLEVQVGGETLAPRVEIVSSGHCLNARYVRGVEMVGEGPLGLYVDAATGDDANDGLTPAKAKRTIQAAFNAIPYVLGGTVTVNIADGTYHEELLLTGFHRRGLYPIHIIGNPTSPQSVVLDGQDVLEVGMGIGDGALEIRGIRITGFTEEGIEFWGGGAHMESCEIVGNGTDPWDEGLYVSEGGWCDLVDSLVANNAGVGVASVKASHLELIGTTVTGNGGHGAVVTGGSDLWLKNATITENGGSGIYTLLGIVLAYPGDGGAQITGNAQGVHAAASSSIEFFGQSTITIQNNTNGDMWSSSHSTISGYGNGTCGSCVETDTHSMCVP